MKTRNTPGDARIVYGTRCATRASRKLSRWKNPSQVLPASVARGRACIDLTVGDERARRLPAASILPRCHRGASGSHGERLQSIPPAMAGSRSLVKKVFPKHRTSSGSNSGASCHKYGKNMTRGCPEAAILANITPFENRPRLRAAHVNRAADSLGRGFGKVRLGLDDGRNPRLRCY